MTTNVDALLDLLRTWMDANSRSPLDGTISCKVCRALVLELNADDHARWHKVRGEIVRPVSQRRRDQAKAGVL